MIPFLRLIRLPNLFIIVLTQYCIRIFLDFSTYPNIAIPDFNFFILSLSTVMIAAAGYIINDYFDIKPDLINKPQKVIVGHGVKRRVAMGAHLVINSIGILLGFYAFWTIGRTSFGFIHVIIAGLLWFYSTTYKKQFIVGNVVVAFLASLVVIIVGLFEHQLVMKIVLAYAGFAFIISLIREIVKDMEDMEGDHEIESKTIPLTLGIDKSKTIVYIINSVLILMIASFQYYLLTNNSWIHFSYLLILLQIPLLSIFWLTHKATISKDFHQISNVLKLSMITGILAMVVFYYI
ncbi:MAG: prenyltransferase [Bacteroidetes bacterium]|nr:MAG: prenyltransferase [Bacteroidota bacterium]